MMLPRDEMLSYYRSIFIDDDVNSGQSFSDASIDYFENILNQVKREQEILARITSLVTDLESVKSDNKALKINWQNDNLEVGLLYVTGSQTDLNINNSTAMTGLGIQYQLGAFNIFLNSFNSAIKSQYKNSTDNIDLLLEQTKSNMDLGLAKDRCFPCWETRKLSQDIAASFNLETYLPAKKTKDGKIIPKFFKTSGDFFSLLGSDGLIRIQAKTNFLAKDSEIAYLSFS